MKKILSVLLAAILLVSSIPIGLNTAYAASYKDQLRAKGFPESYLDKLDALHNKYPNWIFEPVMTGIDFQTAVNGERSSHAKQLIEHNSGTDTTMYCTCSVCALNGIPRVQEACNWVSASETAVKYYMDPRNWLDEKHIFQFESLSYDGTQTKGGVEAILAGTWMSNSLITYKTTSLGTKTYNASTQYSDAILKAASDSNMSAYYLASKIRQENGGPTASATAVNGAKSPFQGIYNYFNIGAYSGAYDGLAWAAGFLKANTDTVLYSGYDSVINQGTGKQTKITSNQYMTWRADKGSYYYVRLYNKTGNSYAEGASGYVLKKDCRTLYMGNTSSGYGRPWTNPYKAIYYGAKYIANTFKTQNTGYFQKFNVSPSSPYLYSNEYMRGVTGAASEAVSTYNGYAKANILGVTKRFYIPVFENMPNEINQTVSVKSFSGNSVTLNWTKTANANLYIVQMFTANGWVDVAATGDNSAVISSLSGGTNYKFRVGIYWNSTLLGYTNEISAATKVSKIKVTGIKCTNTYVTLKWTPNTTANGYFIYIYDASKKAYKKFKTISGGGKSSVSIEMPKTNKTYKFKVCGYKTVSGVKYRGTASDALQIKTGRNTVSASSAKSAKSKRISLNWKSIKGVTGYQVMWSTTKNFKRNFLTKKIKGASKKSTTINTYRSRTTYYVRVRAYNTIDGKTTYYPWSKTLKVKVK